MGCLPYDIMLDILSRLSVKTLAKFRCVSKQWSYSFSDPHFLDLYCRQATNEQTLFLFIRGSEEILGKGCTLYLSSIDDSGRVRDIFSKAIRSSRYWLNDRSISGLICINGGQDIYVCNPFTREFVTLPEGSPNSVSNYQVIGFGYLPSTKEYKVVRLFYRSYQYFDTGCVYEIGCDVFSITDGGKGSNSWRLLDQICPYQVYFLSTFINGSLHWIIRDDCCRHEGVMILSLDIQSEKFRVLPHPQGLDIGIDKYLGVVRDFLCISQFALPLMEEMDIWMLKDYDDQVWVKEYRINFRTMDGFVPCQSCYVRYYRDGEILFETDYPHPRRLDYYNIESRSFRSVEIHQHNRRFVLYTKSLFSLGSI